MENMHQAPQQQSFFTQTAQTKTQEKLQNKARRIVKEEMNKEKRIRKVTKNNPDSSLRATQSIRDKSPAVNKSTKTISKRTETETVSRKQQPFTPWVVYNSLKENFKECFIKQKGSKNFTANATTVCNLCKFNEQNKNKNDDKTFCSNEKSWSQSGSSPSHPRKAFILYNLDLETMGKLRKDALFAFFVKEVQVDEKHRLMFVTLNITRGGGLWDHLAKTCELKFQAAIWDEELNPYDYACKNTTLNSFVYNFELKEAAQDLVVEVFSQKNSRLKSFGQTFEIKNPKDVTGGKRSMESFNQSRNTNVDLAPEKKVKGTSNYFSWEDIQVIEDDDEVDSELSTQNVMRNPISDNHEIVRNKKFEILKSKFENFNNRGLPSSKNDNTNNYTIATLIKEHGINTWSGLLDFGVKLTFEKNDLIPYIFTKYDQIYEEWIQEQPNQDFSPISFDEFMTKENNLSENRMQAIFEEFKSLWSIKSYFKNN